MSGANTPDRRASISSIGNQRQGVSSGDKIAPQLGNLSLTRFTKRPGYGNLGTKVTALVNYFPVDPTKVPDLCEYVFKVRSKDRGDNAITSRYKRRIAFLLLGREPRFQNAGSNYQNIFISTVPLTPSPATEFTYNVDYFEEEENGPRIGDRRLVFQVTLTFSNLYKTRDFLNHCNNQQLHYPNVDQHLNAFNILLARVPAQNPDMVTAARREKFFEITRNNGRRDLTGGLEVYKGYFKSANLTIGGLMLNLNTASSPMYREGSLDELITLLVGDKKFTNLEKKLDFLDLHLARVRVETTYSGRRMRKSIFKMARISRDSKDDPTSSKIFFVGNNDHPTSVENHFKTTYPAIRRPNMNALVINVGNDIRPIYLPADLCSAVPGQPFRGLLPLPKQTSIMIRFACRKPAENISLILDEGLPQMGIGAKGGPSERFGVNIKGQMMSVTARILPSPSLRYANGLERNLRLGSWNMQRKRFVKAAPESAMKCSWIELLLPDMSSSPNLNAYLQDMTTALKVYTGHRSPVVETFNDFQHSLLIPPNFDLGKMADKLRNLLSRNVRLVFMILPSTSVETYRIVKTAADAMSGIHTVCTVRDGKTGHIKAQPDELANEMLKVNQKLGGINMKLEIPAELESFCSRKIMFIGADVVHANSGSMTCAPSIAAVCASIDDDYFLYPGVYAFQHVQFNEHKKPKKAVEFIQTFGDMCESRLKLYQTHNKALPDLIIVYRDGVSDSMFAEVVNSELSQLQQTYRKVYQNQPHPKTIFIIVKKRGHTRFYQPKSEAPGFDKNGNPMPGFIVDREVTSGKVFDWYQVSHKCLQGTSRPAHYVVLHDDLGATADQLQQLTHAMCFTFGRATKSISVHPACRYADLMCDRAKIYFRPVYFPPSTQQGQPRPVYDLRGNHWPGVVASNLRNTMFYI